MINEPLTFTQMSLARESAARKSKDWLVTQLREKTSELIPIWQGDYFFIEQNLVVLQVDQIGFSLDKIARYSYFLGNNNLVDASVVIFDLSFLFIDQEAARLFLSRCCQEKELSIEIKGLRQVLPLVDKQQTAYLGFGRALALWHQSTRFCGTCGSATNNHEAGHCRICRNEDCQKLWFPRTDPVVIMLVELHQPGQPPRCLLAGHNGSPDNLVSTLAGFVDPGESLEQAVRREVFEEAGIELGELEYIASQPWPFPHSIMIGFIAKAVTHKITIDPQEISHAHWFNAKQVAQFSDWGEQDDNTQIPRKESIARYLIDLWLARNNVN